jgi:hypothetical protein
VPRVPHSVSRYVPCQRIVRQRVLSSRVIRRCVVRHEATRSRAARGRDPWTDVARRAAAYALPIVLAGALTAGCAGFSKAFGEREAIVTFRQDTPDSVRLAVRDACSHVPQAIPEPLPTDNKLSDYLNNVRFRIDNASDAELASLETCLSKFSSVVGVETPQDENS